MGALFYYSGTGRQYLRTQNKLVQLCQISLSPVFTKKFPNDSLVRGIHKFSENDGKGESRVQASDVSPSGSQEGMYSIPACQWRESYNLKGIGSGG